jgi:hypothetical protein
LCRLRELLLILGSMPLVLSRCCCDGRGSLPVNPNNQATPCRPPLRIFLLLNEQVLFTTFVTLNQKIGSDEEQHMRVFAACEIISHLARTV